MSDAGSFRSTNDGSFSHGPLLSSASAAGYGQRCCCGVRVKLSPTAQRTLNAILSTLSVVSWLFLPLLNGFSIEWDNNEELAFDDRYWAIAASYVAAVLCFSTQVRLVLPHEFLLHSILSSIGLVTIAVLALDIITFGFLPNREYDDNKHIVYDIVYDLTAWVGCILVNYNVSSSFVGRIALLALAANCIIDIYWYTRQESYFDSFKENAEFLFEFAKVAADLMWYKAILELTLHKLYAPRCNLFVRHEFLLLERNERLPTTCYERRPDVGSVHRVCPNGGTDYYTRHLPFVQELQHAHPDSPVHPVLSSTRTGGGRAEQMTVLPIVARAGTSSESVSVNLHL